MAEPGFGNCPRLIGREQFCASTVNGAFGCLPAVAALRAALLGPGAALLGPALLGLALLRAAAAVSAAAIVLALAASAVHMSQFRFDQVTHFLFLINS